MATIERQKKVVGIHMQVVEDGDNIEWQEKFADGSVGPWRLEGGVDPRNKPEVVAFEKKLLQERGLLGKGAGWSF